jgi:hypothetical protein
MKIKGAIVKMQGRGQEQDRCRREKREDEN